MLKIISFDLDGTLVKNTFADLVWLEGLPKIYAEEKKVDLRTAKQYLLQKYDKVGDTRVEWYDLEYWFQRFNLQSNWKTLLDRYRFAIETYPETPEIVHRLSENYDLVVTSNAIKEFVTTELEETHLGKYFQVVFSSTSDFHKVKKVSEFYLMICDTLNVTPDEMVHVGDHREFDYSIPKSVGIHSFYLDRDKKTNGEDIVHNLKEFEHKIQVLYPFSRRT